MKLNLQKPFNGDKDGFQTNLNLEYQQQKKCLGEKLIKSVTTSLEIVFLNYC